MSDTSIAIQNDYQQVLLAALFGVLTTVLAVASIVVACLQLRKYRLAYAVPDVEERIGAVGLAQAQPHGTPSLAPSIAASEQQVDERDTDAPMPPEVEEQ